jgi:hypothetical protein
MLKSGLREGVVGEKREALSAQMPRPKIRAKYVKKVLVALANCARSRAFSRAYPRQTAKGRVVVSSNSGDSDVGELSNIRRRSIRDGISALEVPSCLHIYQLSEEG